MAKSPLRKSPGKGVLVDTWIYDAEYSVTVDGDAGVDESDDGETKGERSERKTRKVEVELRLIKDFSQASAKPPYATTGVKFTLTCHDVDLSIEGTDVEAMRKAMWEKLDAKYRIDWKRWFLVRVDRASDYDGLGTGLTFGYSWIERGVAYDGSVLMRRHSRYSGYKQEITAWPEQFKEKNGRTLACIEATPENEKALDEFSRRIDEMRRQLAEFVKPNAIQETLSSIARHMELAGKAAAGQISGPRPVDD